MSPEQAEAERQIAETPLCSDPEAIIESGASECREVPSCEEVESGVAEAVEGQCIDPAKIE